MQACSTMYLLCTYVGRYSTARKAQKAFLFEGVHYMGRGEENGQRERPIQSKRGSEVRYGSVFQNKTAVIRTSFLSSLQKIRTQK